jgi:hypothetical protein
MKPTYRDLLANPELMERIVAQARRERAHAVSRLIPAAIGRIFARREKPDPTQFRTDPI